MKGLRGQLILLVLLLGLIVSPFIINKNAEFIGADAQAKQIISSVDPGYKPWFSPIWEPASGEIESLLFALQAALGSGFICFYIGYKVGQRKHRVEV